MERVVSIRGAITVKENSIVEIKNATKELLNQIFKANNINEVQIINIIFTATDDLNVINPATIAREEFKLDTIPMLCIQEMKVKNGLPMCIRTMVQTYTSLSKDEVKHIYLEGATNLRPDLNYEI